MVFKIVNFNKDLDIYAVISNEGEQKNVTSFQIVRVLLQGYQFDNAYLTQKGFALKTNKGIRYIQVKLDKQTQVQLNKYIYDKKQAEEQRKRELAAAEQLRQQQEAERLRLIQEAQKLEQQRQAEQKKQAPQLKIAIDVSGSMSGPSTRGKSTKIQGNNRSQKIFYKGNLYYSEEQLCKKFNADVDEFRKLRYKGYSIDEALGLKPLRPESELMSVKQLNRVLDSMAAQRGEL